MKKLVGIICCLLTLLACAFALADAEIDETNFPDAYFREFVKKFDSDGNNCLNSAETAAVTEMNCSMMEISSLQGIEYFTQLKTLYCMENLLTELDLSRNTALEFLVCNDNKQLASIDLGKNDVLYHLECGNSHLTCLDVSRVSILKDLVESREPLDLADPFQHWIGMNGIGLTLDQGVEVITDTPVSVSAIELNKTRVSLSVSLSKKGTIKLKSTVSPADADNKAVAWKSSNKKVAKVDENGTVTAIGYGSCTITCTAEDGSGVQAACEVTVTADEIKDEALKYRLNHTKKTATVIGPVKASVSKVKVPATVKANGKTYKVKAVAANAFKGMKKLAAFYTGKNMTTIGDSAFENCVKLKTIGIQSKHISKVGADAFKNTYKNVKLLMPKDLTKSYVKKLVKLLINSGVKKITQVFE